MSVSRCLGLALSIVVTAVLLGVGHAPVAVAGCVGPTMAVGASVDPAASPSSDVQLNRGTTLTVSGIYFHGGCEDSWGPSGGCQAPQPADPQYPLTAVELTLVQGGRTWALGTTDAADRDQLYKILWTTEVPADASAGPAELKAATASLDVELS